MAQSIDNVRFRKLLRAYPIKAIELLHDLYHNSLVRLAKSLTHDEEIAEDIVQETFLHVWIKRAERIRAISGAGRTEQSDYPL